MLEHLRLVDLSDREILLTLVEVADEDSFAHAEEIAAKLGMKGDNAKRCVITRLSWLSRYGAVERELLYDELGVPQTTRGGKLKLGQGWKPTEIGYSIANGQLKQNQTKMLEGLTDAQMLSVTRYVAEQARGMGNFTSSKLIEREWRHRWTRQNGWTRP